MNTNKKTRQDLLETVNNTSDSSLLETLSTHVDCMVRRAVARNLHTPSNVLTSLLRDPVLNVSYMASLNSNCFSDRTFEDTSHPCVNCDKDERVMVCDSCTRLSSYRVA